VNFSLDPKLAADTLVVGDFALSRVLLMNDARYTWLILVPRRAGLVELTDLDTAARATLIEEIAKVSDVLKRAPRVEKINVGALGNIVRQLHVHVVARQVGDHAWPGPVWGAGAARAYGVAERETKCGELRLALGLPD
jgi:diadenosine tetraphosphate (Ap4A) HIT family hydrolase